MTTPEDADGEPNVLLDANEALVRALVDADEALDGAHHETDSVRASEAELRTIADFRETLIGVVGHDLRNPLNAIFIATKLLVTGNQLNAADANLAAHILKSSTRMKRIIEQLLDFTRARLGGGFPLQLAAADLGVVCSEIAAELQLLTKSTVEVHLEGDLSGEWDADRLGTMMSNILGNAIEHAIAGSVVVADVRPSGTDSVVAAITNHGATIPSEFMPHLFDPFRQAEPNAARKAGNLGLGLFIAHEVARSHGGTLAAHSENGTTTFTATLPRVVRA